jgi:hypothetical protein
MILLKVKGEIVNKVYYGNCINLSGLYSKTPIKCSQNHGFCVKGDLYWNKEGDFDIDPNKLGIEKQYGYIKFTSESEQKVKIWTEGVISAMEMLKKWCK